ncbi:MAG TPA: isocitrate lyase/phosphoenolpyruvate mutase family protein [Actinomycetota bacterium]
MSTQSEKAQNFLALHRKGSPLVMPNPWDVGSARLFASLGFAALATTSGGFAGTLGRRDGSVSRGEAIAHAASLAGATDLPLSADLENCFADEPAEVAKTVEMAIASGLAGCSIEDFTRRPDSPIYDKALAAERVAAAADAAHAGPVHLVLTARAENYLHGRPDLSDTISRLQAYQEAGADVLFAPRIVDLVEIRSIVQSVDRPVSVLAFPGAPTVAELSAVGVARVSVGSWFFYVGFGAVADAARELIGEGTYSFWPGARAGADAARIAFPS